MKIAPVASHVLRNELLEELGYVTVPEGPGISVEPDKAFIKSFAIDA